MQLQRQAVTRVALINFYFQLVFSIFSSLQLSLGDMIYTHHFSLYRTKSARRIGSLLGSKGPSGVPDERFDGFLWGFRRLSCFWGKNLSFWVEI